MAGSIPFDDLRQYAWLAVLLPALGFLLVAAFGRDKKKGSWWLDGGATLIVLRQNLDTSAAEALAKRGRRVRLAWRPDDASALDTNQQEEQSR